MRLNTACAFIVNGSRPVSGTLHFRGDLEGVEFRVECSAEFSETLVIDLTPIQCTGLVEFFNSLHILFWKITVLDSNNNMDTLIILNFARESEFIFHLSIEAGINSRHFESPLADSFVDMLGSFFGSGSDCK